MPNRLIRCATAVTVGLALWVVSLPALAAEDSSSSTATNRPSPAFKVQSDGWIRYSPVLSLVGATGKVTSFKGKRTASGACVTPGRSSSKATNSAIVTYTEEVAFNPRTCASEIETATLSPDQASRLETLTRSTGSSTTSTGDSGKSSQVSPRATTYSRYLKTSWIDPINITITSQKVGLRWTSSSWTYWQYNRDSFKGCIGSVCLDNTYIVSGTDKLSGISHGWQFNATVHFRNVSFALWVVGILGPSGWAACGFPTSSQADFYHSDTVQGHTDGSAAWRWDDSKSGACTNLVHHGTETGTSF